MLGGAGGASILFLGGNLEKTSNQEKSWKMTLKKEGYLQFNSPISKQQSNARLGKKWMLINIKAHEKDSLIEDGGFYELAVPTEIEVGDQSNEIHNILRIVHCMNSGNADRGYLDSGINVNGKKLTCKDETGDWYYGLIETGENKESFVVKRHLLNGNKENSWNVKIETSNGNMVDYGKVWNKEQAFLTENKGKKSISELISTNVKTWVQMLNVDNGNLIWQKWNLSLRQMQKIPAMEIRCDDLNIQDGNKNLLGRCFDRGWRIGQKWKQKPEKFDMKILDVLNYTLTKNEENSSWSINLTPAVTWELMQQR